LPHQHHCPVEFFVAAVHLCIGGDQFKQFGVRFFPAILVGGVDDGRIEAVFHCFGDISPADSNFPARQIAAAVADTQGAMAVFEFGVLLDAFDGFEGAIGITGHIRLHRHIDGNGEDG